MIASSNSSCADAGSVSQSRSTSKSRTLRRLPMALKIIVSYDDTDNDRDGLALGRLLAFSGAEPSLASVRHSFGESLGQQDAEQLLANGAESVGTPDMPKYVVVNPATSVGLAGVAAHED